MALISMVVIIVTVITQGARVPSESRGDVRGHLFVSDGFFRAVAVISFGRLITISVHFACLYSPFAYRR